MPMGGPFSTPIDSDAAGKAENEHREPKPCEDDDRNRGERDVVPKVDLKAQNCFHGHFSLPPKVAGNSGRPPPRYSNAKMRFQSSFMLTTIQPCFLATSYISWLKVPTDVFGNPCAGP